MKRLLAVVLLVLLSTSAGCTAIFPGDVDQDDLEEDVEYDWNTNADVTITLERDRYLAVHTIENRSTIELYEEREIESNQPIDPIGPRFRYPNGTVVGPEAMSFEKSRDEVTVEFPADEGQFAYAAPKQGKEIYVVTPVEGASWEVILPENGRVEYPLLGRVVPSGYETEMVDERVHVRWSEVDGEQVVVRYYLVRDLYLLAGLLAVSALAGAVVVVYFWLQLRSARRRREEVGLDVESGDE